MKEEIRLLRNEMKKADIDCYLVMSDDFHGSEYVGDYFKCREFLSGFTGSAGRMVITQKEAILWTDGRYFIQAEEQLENSGISLFKIGEPNVPDMMMYLNRNVMEGWTIGFDGRTVNAKAADNIRRVLKKKNVNFKIDTDIVDLVWKHRPEKTFEKVWALDVKYCGVSRSDKLSNIRKIMDKKKCDAYVVAALDEISWVLNLRGNDIEYNPVFLSFLILKRDEKENSILFANKESFSKEIVDSLAKDGIKLMDYGDVYEEIAKLDKNMNVLLDTTSVNSMIMEKMPDDICVFDVISPIMQLKSVKNETEIQNERTAHIKDGVAVTKLIYWLKNKADSVSEMDVADKLEKIREKIDNYIEPSFATISAYGTNAAIVHYEPTKDTDKMISGKDFLLLDTGGHYIEGTTDITRTISTGKVTDVQKMHYTAVLKGNLRLADAKFLYGCRGTNLDYIAREPLWKMGLDFKHGTGHGVGYLLNVHESPNNFRWKINPQNMNRTDAVLEEGMITSDEPGLYIEGQYGIRLENLVLCKKAENNEYGQFMQFETLTLVPFDCEAIDYSSMNEDDIQLLNAYHARVYQEISPFLDEEERKWLEDVTRERKEG